MPAKTSKWIVPGILLGIILGGVLGIIAPTLMRLVGVFGDIYVAVLGFAVIPLLLTSVVVSLGSVGNRQKLSRSLGKTVLYFAVVGLVGTILGLFLPEIWLTGYEGNFPRTNLHETWEPIVAPTLSSWVYLGLIFFTGLFAASLVGFGNRAKGVTNFLKQTHPPMMKVLGSLLELAPLGLFAWFGGMLARDQITAAHVAAIYGADAAASVILFVQGALPYLASVAIGLVIMVVIATPMAISMFARQSILATLKAAGPAIVTALGAGSSVVALPFTYRGLDEHDDIDQRAGSLVIPLGTVLNVGVTALCAVAGMRFIMAATGIVPGWQEYLILLLAPGLLAVGRAGLPNQLLPILLALIAMLGLPPAAATALMLVLAVDWLVDRLRGAANVWLDMTGAAVIGETFEFKTASGRGARDRSGGRDDRGRDRRRGGRDDRRDRGRDRDRGRQDRGGRGRGGRRSDDRDQDRRGGRGRGRGDRDDRRRQQREPRVEQTNRSRGEPTPAQQKTQEKDEQKSPFELKAKGAPDHELDVTSKGKPDISRPAGPERSDRGDQRGRQDSRRQEEQKQRPSSGRGERQRDERGRFKKRDDRRDDDRQQKTDSRQKAESRRRDDARKQAEKQAEKPAEKPTEKPTAKSEKPQETEAASDSNDGRLSPDTIAQELQRVSAHLDSMSDTDTSDEAEKQEKQPEAESPEPATKPAEETPDKARPEKPEPESTAKAESESPKQEEPEKTEPPSKVTTMVSTVTTMSKSEQEPMDIDETPAEKKSDEPEGPKPEEKSPERPEEKRSYSRKPSRRGPARPASKEEAEEAPKEPARDESTETPEERQPAEAQKPDNISFGRTPHKKGEDARKAGDEQPKSEAQEEVEKQVEEEFKDGFSTEEISSFGRSRRKKPRN